MRCKRTRNTWVDDISLRPKWTLQKNPEHPLASLLMETDARLSSYCCGRRGRENDLHGRSYADTHGAFLFACLRASRFGGIPRSSYGRMNEVQESCSDAQTHKYETVACCFLCGDTSCPYCGAGCAPPRLCFHRLSRARLANTATRCDLRHARRITCLSEGPH